MQLKAGWIDEAIEDDRYLDKSWDRGNYRTQYIVIHKTAGGSSAQGVSDWFAQPDVEASAHFIIGPDGELIQAIPTSLGAWANAPLGSKHADFLPNEKNPNLYTVTIEHVDPATDNSSPLTDAQKLASFRLIATLCQSLNIPARRGDASGGIIGHCDIDAVNRAQCPGNYPWDELWAYLKGGSMSTTTKGTPKGWKDDGNILTAPNGLKVRDGFRKFILDSDWDPADFPLEEEHAQSPVEESNVGLGEGSQQTFRMSSLVWTPQRGVFRSWIGQELIWYRQHYNTPVVREVVPQTVHDDIMILFGNVQKLKSDAGIP